MDCGKFSLWWMLLLEQEGGDGCAGEKLGGSYDIHMHLAPPSGGKLATCSCHADLMPVRCVHGLNLLTAPHHQTTTCLLELDHPVICPSGAFPNTMLCPQGLHALPRHVYRAMLGISFSTVSLVPQKTSISGPKTLMSLPQASDDMQKAQPRFHPGSLRATEAWRLVKQGIDYRYLGLEGAT